MKTERKPGRLRTRVAGLIKTRPKIALAMTFVSAGLLVFGVLWFEPQKLFQEKTVSEPFPSAGPSPPKKRPSTIPTPVRLSGGAFRSLEHRTTGTASVVRLVNGTVILRFEDLDTSNGPDLRVYLSEVPASNDWHAYGKTGTYVELGALKGNRGDQNYAIPSETDLTQYRSAVIWCVRFRVGFGVASLDRRL